MRVSPQVADLPPTDPAAGLRAGPI